MKYLKYILSSVILIAMISCDAFNDPDLPIPLDETMDNTGAFLRVIDVEMPGFDILELETASFIFTAEYWDDEGQSLLDNVQFYSNYISDEGQRPDVGRTLIKTFDAADFGTNEATGWPAQTFEITLTEVNNVLGIDGPNENLLGDRYQMDWVLNLTDGRSFTSADMSPAITGGFFNSPNQRNVDVVAAIPPDEFVGEYRFTQRNNASLGSVFGVNQLFSAMEFDAELEVDNDNRINGRVFQEAYLAAFGVSPHDVRITISLATDTANNSVTLPRVFASGLSCGGAPPLNIAPENDQLSQFELDDDSSFTMVIYDNPENGCGGPSVDVIFDVVKL